MKALDLPTRKWTRGNPGWFRLKPVPVLTTEFEVEVARLGLTKTQFVFSVQLRSWCELNRNRVYVPEWLLDKWHMRVDINFSEVA